MLNNLTTFCRILSDKDFPSKHCNKWRDLCQHIEKRLESESRVTTCSDCKFVAVALLLFTYSIFSMDPSNIVNHQSNPSDIINRNKKTNPSENVPFTMLFAYLFNYLLIQLRYCCITGSEVSIDRTISRISFEWAGWEDAAWKLWRVCQACEVHFHIWVHSCIVDYRFLQCTMHFPKYKRLPF